MNDNDRIVGVPRSVLFGLGRDITSGNLPGACQTIIDLLTADSEANGDAADSDPWEGAEAQPTVPGTLVHDALAKLNEQNKQ